MEDQDRTVAGLTTLLLKAVLVMRTTASALLLAMVLMVDLQDPTAIMMITALGLLPERRTAATLATAEGETTTLATVLLLLLRVILVGLLLPSGATAMEVRLFARPSTLTTMRLAETATHRTLSLVSLLPMLLPRPFLAMLPFLQMATPFLLAIPTAWTATAKLDLLPFLLRLMPLAVLLSLLARPTTLTTLVVRLVPASTEEQIATILAAALLACLLEEETIAPEGTTPTRGPTRLAMAAPTLTLLALLLLGEFSLSLFALCA
jgi:hypothetical protein